MSTVKQGNLGQGGNLGRSLVLLCSASQWQSCFTSNLGTLMSKTVAVLKAATCSLRTSFVPNYPLSQITLPYIVPRPLSRTESLGTRIRCIYSWPCERDHTCRFFLRKRGVKVTQIIPVYDTAGGNTSHWPAPRNPVTNVTGSWRFFCPHSMFSLCTYKLTWFSIVAQRGT